VTREPCLFRQCWPRSSSFLAIRAASVSPDKYVRPCASNAVMPTASMLGRWRRTRCSAVQAQCADLYGYRTSTRPSPCPMLPEHHAAEQRDDLVLQKDGYVFAVATFGGCQTVCEDMTYTYPEFTGYWAAFTNLELAVCILQSCAVRLWLDSSSRPTTMPAQTRRRWYMTAARKNLGCPIALGKRSIPRRLMRGHGPIDPRRNIRPSVACATSGSARGVPYR